MPNDDLTPEKIAVIIESAICSAGYALSEEWNVEAHAASKWLRRLEHEGYAGMPCGVCRDGEPRQHCSRRHSRFYVLTDDAREGEGDA